MTRLDQLLDARRYLTKSNVRTRCAGVLQCYLASSPPSQGKCAVCTGQSSCYLDTKNTR